MTNFLYKQAQFLVSVPHIAQAPKDWGAEVAFAGRSNAGKSSALNAITGIQGLARTSKTPGRTQLLTFFALDTQRRLVDLPGYGFAQVPLAIKQRWAHSLADYLQKRLTLRGLILVMDCRHPLMESDQTLLAHCQQSALKVHILLTKADKLKRGAAHNTLLQVQQALTHYPLQISAQLFSATQPLGVDQARAVLNQWLTLESAPAAGA